MATVAILILNYNGEEHLKRFLPSIIQHAGGYEVIIGDNNSTDASLALLEKSFPQVKVIKLAENHGYAGGYNKLIEQISHDYIALVNSDIEATTGWLEPLVSMLDNEDRLAAVQPKILSYKAKEKFEYAGAAGGYIDKYGYPYCRGRIFDTLEEDRGQYNDSVNVFWASGACFLIKRSIFNECGGFDDDFFAHMEEIDLCWRINNMGYSIKVNGKSTVYHLGGGTLDYVSPQKTYLNYRNGWVMLMKNLSKKGRGTILFIRWWLDFISIFFYFSKGQFKNSAAVIQAHLYILRNLRKIQQKRVNVFSGNSGQAKLTPATFSLVWQYYIKKKRTYSNLIPDRVTSA